MKKNMITIGGKEYPCRMTMGAMLEFKRRTGKEATEIQGTDISLMVVLLYCCLLSSCRADGMECPVSDEMEMADRLSPADLAGWQGENFAAADDAGDAKKK